jgi:hypothetical protein
MINTVGCTSTCQRVIFITENIIGRVGDNLCPTRDS